MTQPIAVIVLSMIAFAGAGWVGARIGERLCANVEPYADGPGTVAFAHWPFAALAACVGGAVAWQDASLAHLAVLAVVTLALAGGAAADLRCGMLPDVLTLGPLALVVALGAVSRDGSPALGAACVAVPFALAALLTRGRGMGWGDVKLAALGGALLGVADAALAFMLAALAAYLVARRTSGVRRPIAFGPYLAASIAATLTIVRTI
jgi:prepilin signal peptidase PulO-like enzyme (type II secretory pathway)